MRHKRCADFHHTKKEQKNITPHTQLVYYYNYMWCDIYIYKVCTSDQLYTQIHYLYTTSKIKMAEIPFATRFYTSIIFRILRVISSCCFLYTPEVREIFFNKKNNLRTSSMYNKESRKYHYVDIYSSIISIFIFLMRVQLYLRTLSSTPRNELAYSSF